MKNMKAKENTTFSCVSPNVETHANETLMANEPVNNLEENWLLEEPTAREYISWNGWHCRGERRHTLTNPPPLDLSTSRLERNTTPPEFHNPGLPTKLPRVDRKGCGYHGRTPLLWPYIPGTPTLALLCQEVITDVDIVAGASLLYALSGHSRYVKEPYLMQRCFTGAIIVTHLVKHKQSDNHSPGHLSERLCCPGKTANTTHFSLGRFQIGDVKMTTVSEIDGFIVKAGKPVEIKTRKKSTTPDLKDTIQASVNGSAYLAQFKLSDDEKILESMKLFTTANLRRRHKVAWKTAGERVCRLLTKVVNNKLVLNAYKQPVLLTFDPSSREPVISQTCKWKNSIIPSTQQSTTELDDG